MMFGIRKWLDHKLGVDVYELRDLSIVKDRGRSPTDVVPLEAIDSWRVEYEMGFDIVTIQLNNGTELHWLDKYNDLLGILQTEIKEKQKEPNQASDATSELRAGADFSSHLKRFPISFDKVYTILSSSFLLPPTEAYVEITGEEVVVRMSWAFRCWFPRQAVAATSECHRRPLSRGVHGWRGRWLVNGSGDRILSILLKPSQRAWVAGFPVRLSELLVSVKDPAELARALTDK